MALTQEQKNAIVTRIGISTNFTSEYSPVNRQWFIRTMIEYYIARGIADSSIESSVSTFTISCKTIVDRKKDFSIGVQFSSEVRRAKRVRRIEVIYGALAMSPDLSLSANANFLDFIIKRRYRTVMRMDYFVNRNSQGYFRYPVTCRTALGRYQVNIDASIYWTSFIFGGETFFKLIPGTPGGTSLSIEKLFTRKPVACEGNLLDCARVLSIIFMDGLFEAVNRSNLLTYLASKPDIVVNPTNTHPYLAICHPNSINNSNFIMDGSAESLFSKSQVQAANLQVGDHVYIYNHPLYKVFNPNGSWRGEHALVYDLGDRSYENSTGILFGGHGKEGTLYQFYSAFLRELKTHLDRVYQMAKVHLNFMQSGVTSDGTHRISGGTVQIITFPGGAKLFEYHRTISFTDFEQRGRNRTQSSFVIGHGFSNPANPNGNWIFEPYKFWIAQETNIASIHNRPTAPVLFVRSSPVSAGSSTADGYGPEFYGIEYYNQTNLPRHYPLFDNSTGRIRIRQITINDLFADPFLIVPGTTHLSTTQPKVDLSPAYQSYLRTRGAIS